MAGKIYTGKVVSDKMDKTVVVSIMRLTQHKRYKKTVRLRSTFQAHDEENTCKVGDKVAIRETRPLSKNKRWVVTEVVERA